MTLLAIECQRIALGIEGIGIVCLATVAKLLLLLHVALHLGTYVALHGKRHLRIVVEIGWIQVKNLAGQLKLLLGEGTEQICLPCLWGCGKLVGEGDLVLQRGHHIAIGVGFFGNRQGEECIRLQTYLDVLLLISGWRNASG